ncbi:hypothetical protein BJ508DRAFT_128419 [Ascobolus immersus RN42]|uniref:Rhodopsin domain-containing protein n=1 Tax=Ascobolus immersus RN42 TaxID=1160509 RepID=A0A3N4I520_ASCIM|nr:hypothetical protein BJ508DRAFT_128419 [Ascobolus immersus RN42]
MADIETLAVSYVCTAFALILIGVRLIWRHARRESLRSDDVWMMISIVPLVMRMGLIHVVLVNGTNNIGGLSIERQTQIVNTPLDVSNREMGSRAVLGTRVLYAAFLWCMKTAILGFYSRLTLGSHRYGITLIVIWVGVILTFIITVLSTFLECRPFSHYLTVTISPPQCVEALGQLLAMGICNITTDLALIIFPLPLIFSSTLPLLRKLQVLLLFSIGFFVIAITLIRLPVIVSTNSMQRARSLWASIECAAACLVANAPILNTFLQDYRRRKGSFLTYPNPHSGATPGAPNPTLASSINPCQTWQTNTFDSSYYPLSEKGTCSDPRRFSAASTVASPSRRPSHASSIDEDEQRRQEARNMARKSTPLPLSPCFPGGVHLTPHTPDHEDPEMGVSSPYPRRGSDSLAVLPAKRESRRHSHRTSLAHDLVDGVRRSLSIGRRPSVHRSGMGALGFQDPEIRNIITPVSPPTAVSPRSPNTPLYVKKGRKGRAPVYSPPLSPTSSGKGGAIPLPIPVVLAPVPDREVRRERKRSGSNPRPVVPMGLQPPRTLAGAGLVSRQPRRGSEGGVSVIEEER